jgi:hypothetical protein
VRLGDVIGIVLSVQYLLGIVCLFVCLLQIIRGEVGERGVVKASDGEGGEWLGWRKDSPFFKKGGGRGDW